MNNLTNKEYNQIKNKLVTVVSFNKDGIRTMTYGGCNYAKAVEEVLFRQSLGQHSFLIENLPDGEVSRNIKDYEKYMVDSEVKE